MFGTIFSIFWDLIMVCAAIVLCCWLFKLIFGLIRGTGKVVKDTFTWTKDETETKCCK